MIFRCKQWERFGNHYHLIGSSINVYQWNTGKNANFLVTAGYKEQNHIEKSFAKSGSARDEAINFALSLKDKYRIADT